MKAFLSEKINRNHTQHLECITSRFVDHLRHLSRQTNNEEQYNVYIQKKSWCQVGIHTLVTSPV